MTEAVNITAGRYFCQQAGTQIARSFEPSRLLPAPRDSVTSGHNPSLFRYPAGGNW